MRAVRTETHTLCGRETNNARFHIAILRDNSFKMGKLHQLETSLGKVISLDCDYESGF